MKLLLMGCEYSGTTTLAYGIKDWALETLGIDVRIVHDHFKIPDTAPHGEPLSDEDIESYRALTPRMMEVIQRHNIYYHTPGEGSSGDGITVGLHFDDMVYGPLYWGYGKKGMIGDRAVIAKHIEHSIMKWAPETSLVHVKTSPEVIANRMKSDPHPFPVVQEKDIEHVLERFEEEAFAPLLGGRITLDTSTATVEESLAEFAEKVQPLLTESDRSRMLMRQGSRDGA